METTFTMKYTPLKKTLLAGAVFAAASGSAMAADVSIHGFTSIVGGATLNEGTARGRVSGAEYKATFEADGPTEGVYDSDISFKPDSIYGLQVSADLGNKLKVTGQVTGAGGEDFEANISWAYVSYDLTDTVTLQAGRQRLPVFFYSDYLDVAYAYHWARLPNSLPGATVDTFEGVKAIWSPSAGNWDYRFELYGGAGDEEVTASGITSKISMRNIIGVTAKTSNDWLQLRATVMNADTSSDNASLKDEDDKAQNKDNPDNITFIGLAAHATFGNAFVVAEYGTSTFEDYFGYQFDASGLDTDSGWYISTGYRLGAFTPHITYGENTRENAYQSQGGAIYDTVRETWTVGLRWDFHPSAALKVEYVTQSDASDDVVKNDIGFGVGYGNGDQYEVDLFSVGVDVIF